ncbi:MAG: hypothetical protein IPM51_08170 [Sphingobacteriaceae bacterium]|nr:hypothetical protein [Sphingobacteriaceae bacterium]
MSDDYIVFTVPGSTRTLSTSTHKIEKIKYRNGKTDFFSKSSENEENNSEIKPKSPKIDAELKSKIETLVQKSAKKIKHCAIGSTDNFSSGIDWGLTHFDEFNSDILLVYFTVHYDHKLESQRESFNIRLTVNNAEKTIVWKLLKASDSKAENALLRCQSNKY